MTYDDDDGTREFRLLAGAWHNFLASQDALRHDGFVRAVTTCAEQLEQAIARAEERIRELEDAAGDDDPGPAPARVRPLTGGIGVFGRDWTDE